MNVPALRILESEAPPANPDGREVVMRDPDGTVCAYGWYARGQGWLELPGVARFRFAPGSKTIEAFPEPSATHNSVLDGYYSTALPLALQALGFEALHASAVRAAGGVVAFTATSGTGKTTVACGMAQRGHALWADDATVFETPGRYARVISHPLPFTVNLREPTEETSTPATVLPDHRAKPARVVAVMVLERVRGGVAPAPIVQIDALSLSDALPALLPHGYRFSLRQPDRRRLTVESYLRLAARVPVYRARFTPDMHELGTLLDSIERTVLRASET